MMVVIIILHQELDVCASLKNVISFSQFAMSELAKIVELAFWALFEVPPLNLNAEVAQVSRLSMAHISLGDAMELQRSSV